MILKINKKQLGSSMRRGALVGTMGGFLAGWMAFAAHAVEPAIADQSADVSYEEPAAVPAMPTLRPLPTRGATADPTATSDSATSGTPTSGSAGSGSPQSGAAANSPAANAPAANAPAVNVPPAVRAVAPAVPVPVLAPLPPAPKPVVKPLPTTAPTKKP
jgi:hypothetical protein